MWLCIEFVYFILFSWTGFEMPNTSPYAECTWNKYNFLKKKKGQLLQENQTKVSGKIPWFWPISIYASVEHVFLVDPFHLNLCKHTLPHSQVAALNLYYRMQHRFNHWWVFGQCIGLVFQNEEFEQLLIYSSNPSLESWGIGFANQLSSLNYMDDHVLVCGHETSSLLVVPVPQWNVVARNYY